MGSEMCIRDRLFGIQSEMDSSCQFRMLPSYHLLGAMEAAGERLDGIEEMSDLFERQGGGLVGIQFLGQHPASLRDTPSASFDAPARQILQGVEDLFPFGFQREIPLRWREGFALVESQMGRTIQWHVRAF